MWSRSTLRVGIPVGNTTVVVVLERRESSLFVDVDSRKDEHVLLVRYIAAEDSSRESPLSSMVMLCTCKCHNRAQRSGIGTYYLGMHIETSRIAALRK